MKHQIDFLELLQIDYEKYPVIAVVGGGGKTSLIYRLTDELIDKGKRVIITTTTHMAGESELPFARGGDAVRVKELLDLSLIHIWNRKRLLLQKSNTQRKQGRCERK